MIWLDQTKSNRAGHHSGLVRVATRLREELGEDATAVGGMDWAKDARAGDWFLTAEVFSAEERPGWDKLVDQRSCRLAAIFHDAIPMKWPQITWPQSVRRHPSYLKMLARFDLVWAVSETSRSELVDYWRWLGLTEFPPVEVLGLGADFAPGVTRGQSPNPSGRDLLCVGIIEPRKNQGLVREACEQLWNDGLEFNLHFVGRVNPHFGRPILQDIKRSQRKHPGLHYHGSIDDRALGRLYGQARATVFPTLAEGCGLPVLESLGRGVPCVCSDLPALRENATGGGVVTVGGNDPGAWAEELRRIITDDGHHGNLTKAAHERSLPTWGRTAATIRARLSA